MVIYKITNLISGKVYIGQTIKDIKLRWRRHCGEKRNNAINRAIRKYGKENFKIEIIAGANSLSELNYLEEHYIYMHNSISPNGYNLMSGGKNRGHHSEATKKKLAKLNKGKKCSEHSKKVASITHKGKKHALGSERTQEMKDNLSIKVIGINLETKEELKFRSISEAAKFTKVDRSNISKVLQKMYSQEKGWSFKYDK